MSMHPANLAIRFLLELAALGAMGWWGARQTDGPSRWALAIGVPLGAAVLWGVFAVPGDPSRGGEGVVQVPGLVRLSLEGAVFGFGMWALTDLGYRMPAVAFGAIVVVHYAWSYERIVWLLRA